MVKCESGWMQALNRLHEWTSAASGFSSSEPSEESSSEHPLAEAKFSSGRNLQPQAASNFYSSLISWVYKLFGLGIGVEK